MEPDSKCFCVWCLGTFERKNRHHIYCGKQCRKDMQEARSIERKRAKMWGEVPKPDQLIIFDNMLKRARKEKQRK